MLWLRNTYTLNIVILIFHITESSPDAETTHQKHHWTSQDRVSVLFTSPDVKLSKILTPGSDKVWKEGQWEKYAFLYTLSSNIYLLWTTIAFFFKEGSLLVFTSTERTTDILQEVKEFLTGFIIKNDQSQDSEKWNLETEPDIITPQKD